MKYCLNYFLRFMIVVKTLLENYGFSYNLLFPEPDCINLFSEYNEKIKSISYNSKKDIIVVEFPGILFIKDILLVLIIKINRNVLS